LLDWTDFFVAEVGASASLAGLIFVGLSINISRIISIKRLPGRAIQALLLLTTILVVALLYLIPGQSAEAIGVELIVVGGVAWVVNTQIDLKNYAATDQKFRRSYLGVAALDQICLIFYLISGIAILAIGGSGFYFLVPATIVSFLKAMIDAWVLLVEINR
jgi:hypothetical protein